MTGIGIVGCPGRWSLRVSDGQVPVGAEEELEELVTVEVDDIEVLLICGFGSVPPDGDESGEPKEDGVVEVNGVLLD